MKKIIENKTISLKETVESPSFLHIQDMEIELKGLELLYFRPGIVYIKGQCLIHILTLMVLQVLIELVFYSIH